MLLLADSPELATEQLRAILSYLIALAHVDGEYAPAERDFVAQRLRRLISHYVHGHHPYLSTQERTRAIDEQVEVFAEVAQEIEDEIQVLCDEAVMAKEGVGAHVADKLRLRCAEVLASFDGESRAALLGLCDELILADGVQHEHEKVLRADIEILLAAPQGEASLPRPLPPLRVEIRGVAPLAPRERDADFFTALEVPYPHDEREFRRVLGQDRERVRAVRQSLAKRRKAGAGALAGASDLGELVGRPDFLDGWVEHLSTHEPLEMTVVGDLHGCYGCLKAAVLQCDFLGKVAAWRADPRGKARPVLLFVGDYVDRGRYSFEGVLRGVLALYLHAPEHVVLLRGNHEHFRVDDGQVRGVVQPAEAIEQTGARFPQVVLGEYRALFEALPAVALAGRSLFVHAGIPRDVTLASRVKTLADLGDPHVRFEMSWSDPSTAQHIPHVLQARTSRFAFGRQQFLRFMSQIGATLLVRGHETVEHGVRLLYGDAQARLLNVFSAGGALNEDLPPTSPYRRLAPAAAILRMHHDTVDVQPFPIAYEPYVVPGGNQFYAPPRWQ